MAIRLPALPESTAACLHTRTETQTHPLHSDSQAHCAHCPSAAHKARAASHKSSAPAQADPLPLPEAADRPPDICSGQTASDPAETSGS